MELLLQRSFSVHILIWIVNIGLSSMSFGAHIPSQSLYTQIAQANLKAFSWEDIDWSDNFNEYLHQCLDILKKGQPFQLRKQAFELLGSLKTAQPQASSMIMDTMTWHDLQLFYNDDNNEKYLGKLVDRAITELGKVHLLHMLGEPLTDIKLLQKRQKIVKAFIDNEALLKEVHMLLTCLKEHENKVFSFWYKRDPFWQCTHNNFFHLSFLNKINNSWQILEFKNRFDHYARACAFSANIIATGVLITHGLCTGANVVKPAFLEALKNRFEGSGGELGPLFSIAKFLIPSSQFGGVLSICAGIYCALCVKGQYEWEKDLLFLDECLQVKFIGIQKYMRSVSRLIGLVKQNPLLFENLTNGHEFCSFFKDKKNETRQKLFALLSCSTFKKGPSIFASKGKVLLAYKLLHEHKEMLRELFVVLAEIDAYTAIARLYKEFQNESVQYSFAEYSNAKEPLLELEDFWNPFIDSKKVVVNSLTLGGAARPNVIITGPNTGGKSCNLKACALCLILGQSFGIVPAKRAKFTPFSKIMTHLNIVDNIGSGNSLFKSEVIRAQKILKNIKECHNQEFCFIIMDELFNGTTPQEGEAAAFGYAKFIGSYRNALVLIATHFEQLTQLAIATDYFQNYAVTVKYADNGDILCTFKLEPGISQQNIAFDILRNEKIDQEILDDAYRILA